MAMLDSQGFQKEFLDSQKPVHSIIPDIPEGNTQGSEYPEHLWMWTEMDKVSFGQNRGRPKLSKDQSVQVEKAVQEDVACLIP